MIVTGTLEQTAQYRNFPSETKDGYTLVPRAARPSNYKTDPDRRYILSGEQKRGISNRISGKKVQDYRIEDERVGPKQRQGAKGKKANCFFEDESFETLVEWNGLSREIKPCPAFPCPVDASSRIKEGKLVSAGDNGPAHLADKSHCIKAEASSTPLRPSLLFRRVVPRCSSSHGSTYRTYVTRSCQLPPRYRRSSDLSRAPRGLVPSSSSIEMLMLRTLFLNCALQL